jgi:prepilin-type N-terminal cleavage/methylation domain-containing protein
MTSHVRGFTLVEMMVGLLIGTFVISSLVLITGQTMNFFSPARQISVRMKTEQMLAIDMMQRDIREATHVTNMNTGAYWLVLTEPSKGGPESLNQLAAGTSNQLILTPSATYVHYFFGTCNNGVYTPSPTGTTLYLYRAVSSLASPTSFTAATQLLYDPLNTAGSNLSAATTQPIVVTVTLTQQVPSTTPGANVTSVTAGVGGRLTTLDVTPMTTTMLYARQ